MAGTGGGTATSPVSYGLAKPGFAGYAGFGGFRRALYTRAKMSFLNKKEYFLRVEGLKQIRQTRKPRRPVTL